MITYDFTHQAEKVFFKLPKHIQKPILKKVEHYLSQPNPLFFADRIEGDRPNCYRFRIGDYRVIFDWEKNGILITKVGHRRDIYKA